MKLRKGFTPYEVRDVRHFLLPNDTVKGALLRVGHCMPLNK